MMVVEKARKYLEKNPYLIVILYCAIASTIVWWIGLARLAPLLKLYNTPRLDISFLRSEGAPGLERIVASFIVLAGSYGLAYYWAGKAHGKLAWAVIIVGGLLQAGVLLYMAPFTSTDIFDNISHGRILALYHANPFQTVAALFPHDPFTRFDGWPQAPSAYGPLWEDTAGLIARLAGNGIVQNVIAFKLLPGLLWTACAGVVGLILRKRSPSNALRGVLLLAWNPVALFEVWGNGHNDPAFLIFVLLAIWALLERRYTLTILSLTVGTLVKFMPAVLIPAAGLIALQQLPGWRVRLGYLLRTGLASLGLVVVAYAPFWQGLQTLSLNRRAHLFSNSLSSAIYFTLSKSIGAVRADHLIVPVAAALTVVFALWMAYRAMRSTAPDRFAVAAMLTFAFYLLGTVLFFWPWYTLWLVALIPLVRDRQLRTLAILFSFSAISRYFIVYPAFNWKPPLLQQPMLEIYQVAILFGIPWLYMVYALVARRLKPAPQPQPAVQTFRIRPREVERKTRVPE